jgi:NAD(P)-dependent dehydrogenase (short-subunit alcohol dehydrogenase family)
MSAFGYDGRRVLIIGGATGMGAAAAKTVTNLGGEVVVMDVADVSYPVAESIKVDLRDKASVDAAVEGLGGSIDAVFACAGVADGTAGLMLINFISQRSIIERLVETGALGRGGSVVMISSVAGLGWQQALPTVLEFLRLPTWEEAAAWVEANGSDNYAFSKMAINTYVADVAFPMLKQGIRINAILPGPTDTPLARANADTWLTFGADYREAAGIDTLVPEQMGNVMAFLGSEAASGVNGVTLLVDAGHVSSGITGSFENPIVQMLLGMQS